MDLLNLIHDVTHTRDSTEETPQKRQPRTSHACDVCRRRKQKCSGERPVCQSCIGRGLGNACTYDLTTATTKRKTGSPDLDDSMQSLQPTPKRSMIRSPGEHQHTFPRTVSFAAINDVSGVIDPRRSYSTNASTTSISDGRTVRRATARPPRSNHDDTDNEDDEVQVRPQLGPNSRDTVDEFINTVEDNNSRRERPSILSYRRQSRDTPALVMPERNTASDRSTRHLPPRRDADEYTRLYWEHMHILFPIFHQQDFQAEYYALWEPDTAEKTGFDADMFFSALNLMFALGCKLHRDPSRAVEAEAFYERSRKALCYDVLDTTGLYMLQVLLLNVVYLQSTRHAVRCWNAIGVAVRACQSMQLHVEDHEGMSQYETQMRRRVWYTCLHLDRLVATIFGRPSGAQKSSLPLPHLIDDEYLGRNVSVGVQPPGVVSRLGLFVYSCPLFDIFEDVLTTFYSGQRESSSEDGHVQKMIMAALDITGRLESLQKSLPQWLVESTSNQSVPHVRLQHRVFGVRMNYVKMLALKPLLLLAANLGPDTRNGLSYQDIAINNFCHGSVEAAFSLINTTYDHLDESYRSSPWHTSLYTCAALTVLLVAVKTGYLTPDALHGTWRNGVAILEHYRSRVSSAEEGITILEESMARVLHERRNGRVKSINGSTHIPTPASLGGDIELTDIEIDENLEFDFGDMTADWLSPYFQETDWQTLSLIQ